MFNPLQRFNPVQKDNILHLTLLGIIFVLLGMSAYFAVRGGSGNGEKEKFFTESDKFNAEIALQSVKEEILPGSIRVPILIYHSVAPHGPLQTSLQRYYDVAPEQFAKQMQYLRDNGWSIIALDYLADALEQNISLPPKSIVITLDDGWENQYKWAYPILKKYGYTATFFVFTRAIDSSGFMTWDEVKTLDENGMTIGGHTRTHPYLADITDPVALRSEIIGGKGIIENRIGRPIYTFAYPYGHYNDQIIDIVKEAGYKTARSTYYGTHNAAEELYKLKSIEVTDDFDKFVKDINAR